MPRRNPPLPPQVRESRTHELLVELSQAPSPAERAALCADVIDLNLGLCDVVVARYLNRGADRDDLLQVARLALLLAVRRFDPTAGSTFTAFAMPTILGELKRHFRDYCWMVRPPRPLLELRARARTCSEELEQIMGRTATAGEIAGALGVAETELAAALQIDGSYRPASLDPPGIGGPDHLAESDARLRDPSDAIERLVDTLTLQRMIAVLPIRDRKVLRWRFDEGCTQQQIADRLGVSQMQVSRILRRILRRLRDELEAAQNDEPAVVGL